MKEILYIIGNGFDLSHEIPTKYSDFREFCKNNYPDLFETITQCLPKLEPDRWSNFENALGLQETEVLLKGLKRNEQTQRDYDLGIEKKQLDKAFGDWIVKVKESITKETCSKKIKLLSDSYFLSFNYTNTLEKIYDISTDRICHIHGYQPENTMSETLFRGYIYGHSLKKEDITIDDKNFLNELEKQDITNEILYFKKEYRHEELEKNLKNHPPIDIIFVLGHSMDKVDAPYFQVLSAQYPDAVWYIGAHDTNDRERKRLRCFDLNINNPIFFDF